MRYRQGLRIFIAAIAVALVAACATTELAGAWANPKYAGKQYRRLFVTGVFKDDLNRRVYEDEWAAQLKARGVSVVPSYSVFPANGEVEETRLSAAVRESGAEAMILTRIVKVEKETVVTPGYIDTHAPNFGPVGYYGHYRNYWATTYYQPPQVNQYDVVTAETQLIDVRTQELVWSGRTQSFAPGRVQDEVRPFVSLILKSLAEQRLL